MARGLRVAGHPPSIHPHTIHNTTHSNNYSNTHSNARTPKSSIPPIGLYTTCTALGCIGCPTTFFQCATEGRCSPDALTLGKQTNQSPRWRRRITEKVVSAACGRRGGGEESSGNDMSPLGVAVPKPYNQTNKRRRASCRSPSCRSGDRSAG